AVYPILLDMMSVDPAARPDANMIIRQLDDILEGNENQLKVNGKGINPPVFKIARTPITVVNLNKKSGIQVGSIKQDKNPGENSVNDINLRFVDISRKHLQLNYIISAPGEEKIEICDLHSKYGVFLNSERLEPGKPREVLTGDIIQLGNIISFRFTGEAGYYLLKNVSAERKKGNLLWLDKKQAGQLPDKQAAVILLTKSVSLAPFGFGENTSLVVDENDDIEVKGWPVKTPVKGDIIL
ncbi:MAG: FHA domain-containing protein, partial [bacterium]|nr:FHA domain-containing protein [bacterium]